jgi:S1-C subfamily serine protease
MEFDFTRDKMTWTRLNFDPGLPKAINRKGRAEASLDAIGSFMKVLALLLEKKPPARVIPRGFLGIELAPAEKGEGVLIRGVLAKSPAAQAGLQPGDVITEFQGGKVSSIEEVQENAARLRRGQMARFTVHRKGMEQKIVVKAGEGL